MKNPTTTALLAAALALGAGSADAGPQPTAATDGVSFESPAAGVTNITAPDNAIIDYASFNIGAGETVNFIQPGASARVLNRIHSATPTQIDGTITANGILYLVNPSGVTFGPGAVVDVAGLFAAAGSLSNDDFLSGVNRFDGLTGAVQQQGTVRADTIAALVGREVINTGTVSVPDGTAILASGSEVFIGSPLGGVMVQLDITPRTEEGGVAQDGTVNAEQVSLAAGDIFALAITIDPTRRSGPNGGGFTIAEADSDGDGDIDIDDLNNAFSNATGPLPAGTTAPDRGQLLGDVDGDGDTDDADFGILFALYTGPITTPPVDPPVAGDFDLADDITRLPEVLTLVNLPEADLSVLRDQLGITPRAVVAQERIEKVQARALYNDLSPTFDHSANPDGSYSVANSRLDSDVVREALQLYNDRLAVEGLAPAGRTAQIKSAMDQAFSEYASPGEGFDADHFVEYMQRDHPALLADLGALEALREITLRMGLSEREKTNSESVIINRVKPAGLTYEQMKATLESAGSFSLAEQATTDAG